MIARSEVSLAAEADERRRRRVSTRAVTVAILATVALASWLLVVRLHVSAPYAGDEPHYLIVANSFILDGDADVKNDYTLDRYHSYYPYPIDPHINTTIFKPDSPHWYSWHGVGLSALLVPAVLFGDTRGATVMMVAVATLVLVLTFFWTRRFTGEMLYAGIATGALAVSPFFLGLEGRIFTDLVTAALLLGCLLILDQPERRARDLLLLGTLIGISPWFHFKNALPFGLVAVVAFVQVVHGSRGAGRVRRCALLVLPALLLTIGYELTVHDWYGSWLPSRMVPPGPDLFAISPLRGIAATSFDSARGLLSNNPALLLVLAGLPIWFVRYRRRFLRFAFVVGPTILIESTFNNWHGGYAPPGRYALQLTPTLIPAIALVLRNVPKALLVLAGVLVGIQAILAGAFFWLRPAWAIEGFPSPFLTALDRKIGVTIERLMPTFDPRATVVRGQWQLACWIIASALLVGYGVYLAWTVARATRAPA